MISTLKKYAPAQLASSLSVFALVAIHARMLDVAQYGLLALLIAASEVIRAVSAQWINNALIRLHPAAHPDEKATIAETAAGLILLLMLPSVGAIAICLYAYNQSDSQLWIYLAALLLFKSLFLYSTDLSRVNNQSRNYRKSVQIQAVLVLAFSWLFLSYSPTLRSAVAAVAASYFVPWIIVYAKTFAFEITLLNAVKIANYGAPILLAGFINVLGSRIDRFVLGEYLDFGAVGAYSALSNATLSIMALGFSLVSLPLYPNLARKSSSREELQIGHARYLDLLLAVTLPAAIGFCFVADEVLSALITKEYMILAPELAWMLCLAAFLFNLKGHYFDHAFQFLLKTKYLPWLSVGSLLLSVTLLLILVPLWGAHGAATAWAISTFSSAIASFYLASRLGYKFRLGRELQKIVFGVAFMAVSIHVMQINLSQIKPFVASIILVIAGIFSYVTALVLTNAFELRSHLRNVILNRL